MINMRHKVYNEQKVWSWTCNLDNNKNDQELVLSK